MAMVFNTRPDMLEFLKKERDWMGKKFELFTPADKFSVPTRHLVWLKLTKVPLGAWNEDFFATIASFLGTFICVDEITRTHGRYDLARVLISSSVPFIQQQVFKVKIDDEVKEIIVQMDESNQQKSPPHQSESGYTSSSVSVWRDDRVSEDSVVPATQSSDDLSLPDGVNETVDSSGPSPPTGQNLQLECVQRETSIKPIRSDSYTSFLSNFLKSLTEEGQRYIINLDLGQIVVCRGECNVLQFSFYDQISHHLPKPPCVTVNPNLLLTHVKAKSTFLPAAPLGQETISILKPGQTVGSSSGPLNLITTVGPQINISSIFIDLGRVSITDPNQVASFIRNTDERELSREVVQEPPIFAVPSLTQERPTPTVVQRRRGRPKSSNAQLLHHSHAPQAASSTHVVATSVHESEVLEGDQNLQSSEDNILTRARRAYLVGSRVGVVFNCSEEEAIEGFKKQIQAHRSNRR